MTLEHLDVLIVGAGISGISGAYHLKTSCPSKRFAIFEGRSAIGGTWDLFRYPGIRSDSDMYTLGFSFKPWREAKAIADGPAILRYLHETANELGIKSLIRLNHRVVAADWDSQQARWIITYRHGPNGELTQLSANFIYMCTGYYNYLKGHRPDFPGEDAFEGDIIHPQFWPEHVDYRGKRVVIIGSGATAVTLVPAMAETAGHVTMLQRSPTYVVSRPGEDAFANWLRKVLPSKLAYGLIRWRNVLFQLYFYTMARKFPDKVKERLLAMLRNELPVDFDMTRHFTPSYNPWDQRLCLVPDSDLFTAIKSGKASVATDHIDHFDAGGIMLTSGRHLDADVIVTATGLELQVLSGVPFSVDGRRVDFAETFSYKGMMFSGVPNLASAFGYTNASWTLKADLTAEYVCRLINHMDSNGQAYCVPQKGHEELEPAPWLDFTSGYVTRAMASFPKQGHVSPWKVHQNYLLDLLAFRFGKLDDSVMHFAARPAPSGSSISLD
ncbi:flavin-containing monooxygenase [Candidatus Phycosocius bacilliformis]|uniref:flavin-containing monooxygenase n=1 Tax=Candidatus Phycosocius bacilliformis TaxID=1445552 RepID=UPI000D59B86E